MLLTVLIWVLFGLACVLWLASQIVGRTNYRLPTLLSPGVIDLLFNLAGWLAYVTHRDSPFTYKWPLTAQPRPLAQAVLEAFEDVAPDHIVAELPQAVPAPLPQVNTQPMAYQELPPHFVIGEPPPAPPAPPPAPKS